MPIPNSRPISAAETLCRAIRGRRHVLFVYDHIARAVEPHIVGLDHGGQVLLSAWQLLGGSGQGFRSFHVAEISQLTVSDTRFAGPRPEYNPDHNIFAEVLCQL